MRSVKKINKIKYDGEWEHNIGFSSITYRLFTYLDINWNVILRNNGVGGWTIRLCNDSGDELYVFNSGVNRMSISINDDLIYLINGWYYEDLNQLKEKLNTDLIILLRKYEEYIKT